MKLMGFYTARVLFLLPVLLLWGCSTSVKTKMLAPARAHQVAQLARVAVIPFSGTKGSQISNEIETTMVSVQVDGKPFFRVIERAEIAKVAKEHRFQMSGLVDDATAASFGKILGVQSIVIGVVNQYKTEDKHYSEKRSKCSSQDKKGNCRNYSEYSVSCTERTANIQFTPKIVNIETGSIAASEVMSGIATDSACSDSGSALQGRDELLELARRVAMKQYRTFIAPYYVDVEIKLITSDDSHMEGQVKDKIDQGVGWAKAGRLDRACECWEDASKRHKGGYAIPYLLGVCCEVRGELDKAQAHYTMADRETTKPVKEISASLARVGENIEKQRKLREQIVR
jgi:hypothetical protein